MKKWKTALFLLTAFLVLWASGAAARDIKDQYSKIGVGAKGGLAEFTDELIVDTNSKEVIFWEYDGTSTYGLDAIVFLNDTLSVQLSVERLKTDVTISGKVATEYEQFKGQVTMVPTLVTARFHPKRFWGFMPYVGGGGGFYYNKWESEARIFEDMRIEHSFGGHAVLGLEYIIKEHHGLNLEGRYTWNSFELKQKTLKYEASQVDENIKADGYCVTFGYRYYFW